ncbi:MAG: RHS repeat protein [Burkholderiales bacterium]|nr:RHS repeat protein [Burkholderiales bacterium]
MYPTQTCWDKKPANSSIQQSARGVLFTNDRTYYCGAGTESTPTLLLVECDSCDPAGGQDRRTRFSEQDYVSPRFPFARFYTSDNRSSLVGKGWRSTYHRAVRFDAGASAATVERADGSETVLGKTSGQIGRPAPAAAYVSKQGDQLIAEGTGWRFQIATGGSENFGADGNLLSTQGKDGYTQTIQMANGIPTGVSDSTGTTMQFSYSGNLLSRVSPPAGAAVTFGRDAGGNLSSVTRPDGSNRQYTYTADKGLLQGVVGETGQTYASFAYDPDGLSTTHSAYGDEADGQVKWLYADGTSAPATGSTKLPIPIGSEVRRGGVTWRYMYLEGFAIEPSLQMIPYPTPFIYHGGAIGLYITQVYKICPSVSCPGLVETRTYDDNGNLASVQQIGSDGQMHTVNQPGNYADARDLPGTQTLDGVVATTTWQPQFALPKQVKTPNKTEDYTYDSAGNVTGYTVTDTTTSQKQAWTYGYTNSKLTTQTDPAGLVATLGYDLNGNLNSVALPSGQTLAYAAYDSEGRVGQITGSDGSQVQIKYDVQGRIATKTQNGLTTTYGYAYNATGEIDTVRYPNGQQLTYQYDAQHRLMQITDADGNSKAYTYDGQGRVLTETVQSAN